MQRGLISEADIDVALARTFCTRFKLGMFDPPGDGSVCVHPHERGGLRRTPPLAYEQPFKSVVLLKNKNHTLPFPENDPQHPGRRPDCHHRSTCLWATTTV